MEVPRPGNWIWDAAMAMPDALANAPGQELNPCSTATWAAAVGFLTYCITAGTPVLGFYNQKHKEEERNKWGICD